MKKIIIGIVSVLTFAFPLVSYASFDTNLSYGSHGQAVKELQDFLTTQGDFTGQSTGNFFSVTQQSVISFQKANNISPASGYFGNISRGVANQILATQLSASNDQALQETGTTTAFTEPTLKDTLVSQISALTAQIQALQLQLANLNAQSQQQTAIQQQTQQGIQQIQQNTTPSFGSVTPPPAPIEGLTVTAQIGNNPVSNGSNIYFTEGSQIARLNLVIHYTLDGKSATGYSANILQTPLDSDLVGNPNPATYTFNCNVGICDSFELPSLNITDLGVHTYTVTVGSLTQTFTVDMLGTSTPQ